MPASGNEVVKLNQLNELVTSGKVFPSGGVDGQVLTLDSNTPEWLDIPSATTSKAGIVMLVSDEEFDAYMGTSTASYASAEYVGTLANRTKTLESRVELIEAI